MRAEVASYVVQKWIRPEYIAMREKRGLTAMRVIGMARRLREKHLEEFSLRTITAFCLDNPYRGALAQKVILNEARKVNDRESRCGVRAEGGAR